MKIAFGIGCCCFRDGTSVERSKGGAFYVLGLLCEIHYSSYCQNLLKYAGGHGQHTTFISPQLILPPLWYKGEN